MRQCSSAIGVLQLFCLYLCMCRLLEILQMLHLTVLGNLIIKRFENRRVPRQCICTEWIISETDSPWCHSCHTLLKFYWHKTGLSNRKIRSSNSFYRSWAALLCYPSTQSTKYVQKKAVSVQSLYWKCLANSSQHKYLFPGQRWNLGSEHKWTRGKKTIRQILCERGNLHS